MVGLGRGESGFRFSFEVCFYFIMGFVYVRFWVLVVSSL